MAKSIFLGAVLGSKKSLIVVASTTFVLATTGIVVALSSSTEVLTVSTAPSVSSPAFSSTNSAPPINSTAPTNQPEESKEIIARAPGGATSGVPVITSARGGNEIAVIWIAGPNSIRNTTKYVVEFGTPNFSKIYYAESFPHPGGLSRIRTTELLGCGGPFEVWIRVASVDSGGQSLWSNPSIVSVNTAACSPQNIAPPQPAEVVNPVQPTVIPAPAIESPSPTQSSVDGSDPQG